MWLWREQGGSLTWMWVGSVDYPPSSKTMVGLFGGLMSGTGSFMR